MSATVLHAQHNHGKMLQYDLEHDFKTPFINGLDHLNSSHFR